MKKRPQPQGPQARDVIDVLESKLSIRSNISIHFQILKKRCWRFFFALFLVTNHTIHLFNALNRSVILISFQAPHSFS